MGLCLATYRELACYTQVEAGFPSDTVIGQYITEICVI